jgi:hypothetical protein
MKEKKLTKKQLEESIEEAASMADMYENEYYNLTQEYEKRFKKEYVY